MNMVVHEPTIKKPTNPFFAKQAKLSTSIRQYSVTALQSNFFRKTLDSDTLKIYISAQASSFAHEKELKTRNFKLVCGKE